MLHAYYLSFNADTIPLLAGFLAVFHLAFIIPILILTTATEREEYSCNQKTKVRFALFGTLFLYALSALNEIAVLWLGMRGGPLEERSRRAVSPLLHFEVLLWFLILGMTCYATYVGESPSIAQTCWSNNPCQYSEDVIPSICTVDKTNDVMLTDACNAIWNYSDEFSVCFDQWLDYGSTALYQNYADTEPGATYLPLPDREGNSSNDTFIYIPEDPVFYSIDPATYVCDRSIPILSKKFENFFLKAFGIKASQFLQELGDVAGEVERIPFAIKILILDLLNIDRGNNTVGSDAPWFDCFTPRCQYLLKAGDDCTEWRTLLNVPSSSDRKSAYLSTLYASWVILLVQALIVYIAFNAWPQYENEEAWEGTVQSWGRMFCCGEKLEAETESGQQANKEIGALLHILFGAIDLDPSDQFLGMFLVSERQKLRRHKYALAALRRAGIVIRPASRSWFIRSLQWFQRPITTFRDWFHRRDDIKLVSTLEGPEALVLKTVPGGRTRGRAANKKEKQKESEKEEEKKSDPIPIPISPSPSPGGKNLTPPGQPMSLPPSPFDAPSPQMSSTAMHTYNGDGGPATGAEETAEESLPTEPMPSPPPTLVPVDNTTTPTRPAPPGRDLAYTPPSIAHSFVRLISLRPTLVTAKANNARTRERSAMAAIDGAPKTSSWATWFTSSSAETVISHTLSSIPASAANKKLVVDERPQPLVTPVTLHQLALRMDITSYEAAQIYGITHSTLVTKRELQEMLDLSFFAKAAYGLQKVKWAYGSQSQGCVASTWDSILATPFCAPFRKPLGFDSHFRKRNFNAILQLTGIDASDLLYVSYASAPFGVLPYMVLLHRASKSVVVSVRGTVGFDDLITDLLSNPVDARTAMPAWVKENLGEDAPMYAHAGILSSTNAVLNDLEGKGLLAAMLNTAGEGGSKRGSGHLFGEGSFGEETSPQASGDQHTAAEAKAELDGGIAQARQTQKVLSRLRTMKEDDEIDLDLNRAQSVVNEAVSNRGWRVVVTGHSLGAAVACMMSFQLRQYFPTLRCFAFCPPGGLLSPNLAALAKGFCTSVVVGCDCITRLSFPTTQRIVDDMVLALARCKRPKLAVLLDVLLGRRKDPESTPPTFCSFEDMGAEASAALKRYVATSKLHSEAADTQELFPPGRIIHLRPFAAAGKAGLKPENDVWDAVWASGEQLIGEGVLLSFDMMRHHRIPCLQDALRSAIAGEAVATAKKGIAEEDEAV